MNNKYGSALKEIYIALALCSSALLASCQSASSTISTADNYLEALRAGDAKAIATLTCLKDPKTREELTPGITSWDFIDESTETSDHDPLGTSTSVLTKISYEGIASPVENLFEITVWKTEDLYQYQLRRNEEFNQGQEDVAELSERINTMLGSETDSSDIEDSPSEAPSRDELTSKKYCVTQLRQSQP